MTDINLIADIIEVFISKKFKTNELAGTVIPNENQGINLISINFEKFEEWNGDVEALVNEISDHIRALFMHKNAPEWYCTKYNNIKFNVHSKAGQDYSKLVSIL